MEEDPHQNECYDEVLGLLAKQRLASLDFRRKLAEALLQLAEQSAFVSYLRSDASRAFIVAKELLRNVGADFALSSDSLKACINLSGIDEFRTALEQAKAVCLVADNLREQQKFEAPAHEDLNCILLAQLTRERAGTLSLFNMEEETQSPDAMRSLLLHRLIRDFLRPLNTTASSPGVPDSSFAAAPGPLEPNDAKPDKYLFVSHLLLNVTAVEAGQRALLNDIPNGEGLLAAIAEVLLPSHPAFSLQRRLPLLRVFCNLSVNQEWHLLLVAPPKNETDCTVLRAIFSLIYPPRGSAERGVQGTPLLSTAVQSEGSRVGTESLPTSTDAADIHVIDKIMPTLNHTRTSIRNITSFNPIYLSLCADCDGSHTGDKLQDPFVNLRSLGLVDCLETRQIIMQFLTNITKSPVGRQGLRDSCAYEVIRVWHLVEPSNEIKEQIENMVHLIVYSEAELAEQDNQILSNTTNGAGGQRG